MRENDDRIPVVDDGTLFAVAAVLAAAVIDANPGYADEAKFEAAADQIREKTLGFLKTVRTMSGMGGKPILHHMFKVAGVKTVTHPANLNCRSTDNEKERGMRDLVQASQPRKLLREG